MEKRVCRSCNVDINGEKRADTIVSTDYIARNLIQTLLITKYLVQLGRLVCWRVTNNADPTDGPRISST